MSKSGTSDLETVMAFHIRALGLGEPEREYRFHPKRQWRFDFAWPTERVALEVEGGIWTAGRHVRGSGFEADCEKYTEAAIAGWLVIRASGRMVEDGRAAELLARALAQRRG